MTPASSRGHMKKGGSLPDSRVAEQCSYVVSKGLVNREIDPYALRENNKNEAEGGEFEGGDCDGGLRCQIGSQ